MLLNNMCEVFNSKIVDGRDKPIITVLEYIREYLMRRIVNVLQVIDKSNGPLTPYATVQLDIIKKEAAKYSVQWNGGEEYEVSHRSDQCVVNVVRKVCSCRRWEVTGIPCKHAVATNWNMVHFGQKVSNCYTTYFIHLVITHILFILLAVCTNLTLFQTQTRWIYQRHGCIRFTI